MNLSPTFTIASPFDPKSDPTPTATRIKKIAPELNTIRAPMQKALENAGSKARQITNEPLKLGMRKGGSVKKMSSGGKTSTASSRGDGIAQRGKTRGRIC